MARPHPCRDSRRLARRRRRAEPARRGDGLSDPGWQMMRQLLAAAAFVIAACAPALAADVKSIDMGKQTQVWFVEDHTVPIVSFNISLPAGAAYDPAGRGGLASFAAAMMDEGAGNLDSA